MQRTKKPPFRAQHRRRRLLSCCHPFGRQKHGRLRGRDPKNPMLRTNCGKGPSTKTSSTLSQWTIEHWSRLACSNGPKLNLTHGHLFNTCARTLSAFLSEGFFSSAQKNHRTSCIRTLSLVAAPCEIGSHPTVKNASIIVV